MVKRIDLRLNPDNPKEMEIMQKIENRDQNVYRNPKDYIVQALYIFENRTYEEQMLRRIIREELAKAKQEPNHQESDMEKTEVKIEMDPDILKYLG